MSPRAKWWIGAAIRFVIIVIVLAGLVLCAGVRQLT